MKLEELDIPNDFFFDIAAIPGSSDEVCAKTIAHYESQLQKPGLHPKLIEVAKGIIGALTEYYEMANFESTNLRKVLPHLSEVARFMEAQTSVDVDVESSGRIKSFYSEYVKAIEKSIEYIEKDKTIPDHNFLVDTWATRDILHPRHDMKVNTSAFYKQTYKLILEFMEHIDELHAEDPNYGIKEYKEEKLLDLQRPKKFSFPPEDNVVIPEHDFLEYAFSIKELQEGFKYLPSSSENFSISEIKGAVSTLKNENVSLNQAILNSDVLKSIIQRAKFDQLVAYRNNFESQILDELSEDEKILSHYEKLPFDIFFDEYQYDIPTTQRDKLKFLDYLNKIIKNNGVSNDIEKPQFKTKAFANYLNDKLSELRLEQQNLVSKRLSAVRDLSLDNFEQNYKEAETLKRYNRSIKDYMKYPKKSGYQSIHMIIMTPYGPYEKQFRTEAQDNFAELGHASHSNSYKPDVKSSFHRLKVTTPFSPKRDASGDIIIPTELGVLPFELAVYNYYKQPFSNFSGGKTLAQFKAEHPTKEDFDKAMLALSPPVVSENLLTKIWGKLFKKKPVNVPKITTTQPTYTASLYSDVPADISAYPNIPNTFAKSSNGASTDDLDPHGDDGSR